MKPAPKLHPIDLLQGMSTGVPLNTAPKMVKLGHHLICHDGVVDVRLAENSQALTIDLQSPEQVIELRDGLKRLLNTWDLGAPRWMWQLEALLDPVSRELYIRHQVRQQAIQQPKE